MKCLLLLGLLSTAAAAQTKTPIHGLVTMGRLDFIENVQNDPQNGLEEARAHPGIYAGAAVNVAWRQLEPRPGEFHFDAIEQGLDAVRAYNRDHPSAPLAAKLRVFGGAHAPDWVKQLDGGPVDIALRGRPMTVGHFWSKPYGDAWRGLQRALAARYDDNSLVREVAVSSCAAVSDEPFILPLGRQDLPALLAAGYSDTAMRACLMAAIDDYAVWRTTAIDYTFNPYRMRGPQGPAVDADFTLQVMDRFRQVYGARGVIANHGLRADFNPQAAFLVGAFRRLGPPIECQTISPDVDWDGAVQLFQQVGGTELEIWNSRDAGGHAPVDGSELRKWRQALQNGAGNATAGH